MSDIRFNTWLHQSGTGGITQVDGGHVGIGTTNPDIAVHTANAKKVNVGIVTANSVYAGNFYGDGSNLTGTGHVDKIIEGDTKVEVFDAGSQYISAEVNGSEKLRITSAGKIGIGTDMGGAPASSYPFGVYTTGTGYLYTETGGSSNSAGLRAKAGTADYTIYTTQGTGQLAVYDNTNTIERLRLDSSGRLIVGNTITACLLYTSPSPRDRTRSRMPSSA